MSPGLNWIMVAVRLRLRLGVSASLASVMKGGVSLSVGEQMKTVSCQI